MEVALHRNGTASSVEGQRAYRSTRAEVLDDIALALRAALDRLALPTARAAYLFVRREGWRRFGFVRLDDHARERFGRSGKWVRGMAALRSAIEKYPDLAPALTGEDGGVPLGTEKAKLIAKVLREERDLRGWIAYARSHSLHVLRAAMRSEIVADDPLAEQELEERALVVVRVPRPVQAAFDEVVELHRAVTGREATVAEAVAAVVAEAPPPDGPIPLPRIDAWSRTLGPVEGWDALDDLRARAESRMTRFTPRPAPDDALAQSAMQTLADFRALVVVAGEGDARELDRQLRRLIELEDELLRRLGEVVAAIADGSGWAILRFAGTGHYAEARLGLPATTLEDRVHVARAAARLPILRDAYAAGRLPLEKALLVLRLLGDGPVDESLERAWVESARECTVKRLRDHVRAAGRRAIALGDESGGTAAPPPPPTDGEWVASRRREPGLARQRVLMAGLLAVEQPGPDVFLRLKLPQSVADDFLTAIEAARGRLTWLAASAPDARAPQDDAPLPSLRAARTFSAARQPLPSWVGLLALLEEAALAWDDPRAVPRRRGDAVTRRDGYRCTAPGCTSRANLEDHHVVFRSAGGSDDPSNRTLLCSAHHHLLHEDRTIAATGDAPLDLTWTMGAGGIGGRFTCDRRL